MSDFTMRQAAQMFAKLGIPVFPCKPLDKVPATRHGFKDATTDEGQITDWWLSVSDYNIGLVTGHLFDVIDLDGDVGLDSYAGMYFKPDIIAEVATPRGGKHLWVPVTGRGNAPPRLEKVDFRGKGGYVLAPFSMGANGVRYSLTSMEEQPWRELDERDAGWMDELFRPVSIAEEKNPVAEPARPKKEPGESFGDYLRRLNQWMGRPEAVTSGAARDEETPIIGLEDFMKKKPKEDDVFVKWFNNLDPVRVVQKYTRKDPKPRDFKADDGAQNKFRCPFMNHVDRNPSCHMNAVKKTWHCKSCWVGGDLIDLVAIFWGYKTPAGWVSSYKFPEFIQLLKKDVGWDDEKQEVVRREHVQN